MLVFSLGNVGYPPKFIIFFVLPPAQAVSLLVPVKLLLAVTLTKSCWRAQQATPLAVTLTKSRWHAQQATPQ